MATTYTDTLFATKYRDDFADSDGYYRILFNSGKVLQGRELTQMQTIIDKQIERFGNNIFKEGAVVKAGGFNIDTSYEFVKLDATSTSTSANVGDVLTGVTSGVKAEVLEIVAASGADPVTYYIRYVNTSASSTTNTTPRFQAGESIGSGRIVQITNTSANPAIGRGTRVTVGESIYFTQGFFVYTGPQTALVSKYSDAPSDDVGFKIIQDVVNVDDDVGLYDNQGGVPNITAPGADRYRIRLELIARSNLGANDNFIHVAVVKNGAIFASVDSQQDLQYKVPRDLLAKRIFENSGNYNVKPFKLQFAADSQGTHILAKVSDGISVVDGYRAARMAPSDIRIKKSTATADVDGEFTAVDYGNYVDVLADSAIGGPSLNNYPRQTLMNQKDFAGGASAKIGTARVRGVHENGANMRYHLFDIKMDAGKSFRNVKSIGLDSDNYFNPLQSGTNTVLADPLNTGLIYPLPNKRPRSIDPLSLEVQFSRKGTSDGAGNFTVSIPVGYALDNAGDWMFFTDAANGGKLNNSSLGGLTTGSSSTTITGLPINAPITAYVYASVATPVIRAKTLEENETVTAQIITDSNGDQIIDLGKPDIFRIKRIAAVDSDGINLSPRFYLDNGQRPGHYDIGRLVVAPGQSAPTGDVYVKFDHFSHSNGNFFAVNSYTGVVDYDDIPSYTFPNRLTVNLRDVLDFRSVKDTRTTFQTADVSPMPQPTNLVQADVKYYLPTTFRLGINKDANFVVTSGQPGFNPAPPANGIGVLPLYIFTLGGNTLNELDVNTRKIEHKRYTMSDIGRIEDRINKLEEVTSLSMLEMNTNNFEVLDSAGLNRTKSGFFADNFTTHLLSDTNIRRYSASIDPINGILRPIYTDDNIRMLFDSATSISAIRKGDNVYMSFTEVAEITQPFATKPIKINPFTTSVYTGNMTISPASDDWHDKNVQAKTVIDGGLKLDTSRALNWNSWNWNWSGRDLEDLTAGSATNTISKTSGNRTTNTVNVIVSDKIVDEVIGERILSIAMLPFIRSRIISIKAQGLRPNTNVYLFFAGDNMADYVREESFVAYSDTTKDYGNTLRGLESHIDGSTALTTDAEGKVDISFQLPNNNVYRYRSGTHEIKIMDVSVNQEAVTGSIARALYVAQGFLDTVHQDIKSTRVLEVEGTQIVTYRPVVFTGGGGGTTGGGVKIPGGKLFGGTAYGINGTPGVPEYTLDNPSDATAGWSGSTYDFTGPGRTSSPAGDSYRNDNGGYDPAGTGGGGGSSPSSSGSSNDGGSNSTGTYICTAAYDMNMISKSHFQVLKRYGVMLRRKDPYMMRFYDITGPWLAKRVDSNKMSGKFARFMTEYYKDSFKGNKLNNKQKAFKVLSDGILRPCWRTIGWILEKVTK